MASDFIDSITKMLRIQVSYFDILWREYVQHC